MHSPCHFNNFRAAALAALQTAVLDAHRSAAARTALHAAVLDAHRSAAARTALHAALSAGLSGPGTGEWRAGWCRAFYKHKNHKRCLCWKYAYIIPPLALQCAGHVRLHASAKTYKVTAVGSEPTPLWTGAWSQRLRPLGETVPANMLTLPCTLPAILTISELQPSQLCRQRFLTRTGARQWLCVEGEYIASLGRDDLDGYFSKNNSLNLLKKQRLNHPALGSCGTMEPDRQKGCSGNWTQDLSHPKRESCHKTKTASGAHASSGSSPCCQPHGSAGSKPPAPCRRCQAWRPGCAGLCRDHQRCLKGWGRHQKYTWPGSSWRPSACEADVIATRPQAPLLFRK